MKTRLITGLALAVLLGLGACNDELDNIVPDKKTELAGGGEGTIDPDYMD